MVKLLTSSFHAVTKSPCPQSRSNKQLWPVTWTPCFFWDNTLSWTYGMGLTVQEVCQQQL